MGIYLINLDDFSCNEHFKQRSSTFTKYQRTRKAKKKSHISSCSSGGQYTMNILGLKLQFVKHSEEDKLCNFNMTLSEMWQSQG